MKRIMAVLPVVLLCMGGISSASADHGGGTGGGCGGDCTPPTLGTDNAGKQIVKGGFAINESVFDVADYKQDIQTQIVKSGKPVTITLTIMENTGTHALEHVGLMLGLKDMRISGMMVPTHSAQIHWNNNLGTIMTEIIDPDDLIKDVNVTESTLDQNNILTFEFTPAKPFDAGTVVVQTWDVYKNTWTNYFHNAIEITDAKTIPDASIPEWIKINAGWWAQGQIDDDTFVQGLEYMIKNKIIAIPPSVQEAQSDSSIPEWIKINAGWWAQGQIDDDTFVQGLQYLITANIIKHTT